MNNVLKVTRNGQILEVILDRPKANAIDATTSRMMGQLFCEFRDDPALRVAIITGGGEKFFSAGWDLSAAAEGEDIDGDYGPGGFAGITELHDLNKPLIAAVNGMAVGGGFELALACDLIIAADHVEFGLPESETQVAPGHRVPWTSPSFAGRGGARMGPQAMRGSSRSRLSTVPAL